VAQAELTPASPAERAPPLRRPARLGHLALYVAMIGMLLMGFNRTRLAGWPVSDLAFLAAAGIVTLDMLAGHSAGLAAPQARRSSPPILLGTILLLTAGTVSAFDSWDPNRSIAVVARFAWVTLGWFWLLRVVTADRVAVNRLMGAWRLMLLANCAIAVLGQFGVLHWTVENAENRQTAFFDTPNDLAGLLVVGLPLVVLGVPRTAASAARPPGRELAARGLASAFVVYAIATTGSMTAFIAAGASGVAIAAVTLTTRSPGSGLWRRNPLLPMLAVAVGVTGLVALAASDLPVVDRFTRYTGGDSGVISSVDSRDQTNAQVIDRFDESLVTGTGFGGYNRDDQNAAEASGAHNMFLRIVYQAGLPGLVGLLVVLGFALRHVLRLIVNTRGSELYPVAVCLLGTLVAANAFAMFQPTEFHRYYWLPIGAIGVLWALRREELRRAMLDGTRAQ
jgi:O-antigen ligase